MRFALLTCACFGGLLLGGAWIAAAAAATAAVGASCARALRVHP